MVLTAAPRASAQTAAAPPPEKPVEAPGAEYTEPTPAQLAAKPAPVAAPAPIPSPIAQHPVAPQAATPQPVAPATQTVTTQTVTTQTVTTTAPVAAATHPPAAATTADISAPLLQSAPGTRGAALQEHQMEQLRAILAPVPARPKDIIQDQTKVIMDEYKETTFDNLARMYWAVGKFQDDDDVAVDNYLMITECKLYQQYFNNDFEWKDIRSAARQFIRQNLSKMPLRFEALIPITLDRYDIDSGQFLLKPDSIKEGLLRLAVETNWTGDKVCGQSGDIAGYPRNIIMRLNRPFTLKSFPVDPRIAELYIMQTRLDYQNKHLNEYKRIAYLRFKVRMMQYKEDAVLGQGQKYASIYAALEGWDVFADENETKPMYSYVFPKGYLPRAAGFGDSAPKQPAQKAYIAR